MTEPELVTWLEAYQTAWESRDPDAAASLFSEQAAGAEADFGAEGRVRAKTEVEARGRRRGGVR